MSTIPPKWFLRELKIIDPKYFVAYNRRYDYFEIRWKVHFYKEVKGKYVEHRSQPTLATFRHLNDAALTNLRERKKLGEQFERKHDSNKYLQWIQELNREAKAKKQELALETITEGFMRIYNVGRRKMFT